MEPACRKDKPKLNSTPTRGDRAKQKSAQQELKQRQRAEIYALNKVMTELEQQQFEAFCKQMQSQGEWLLPYLHLESDLSPYENIMCAFFLKHAATRLLKFNQTVFMSHTFDSACMCTVWLLLLKALFGKFSQICPRGRRIKLSIQLHGLSLGWKTPLTLIEC